MGGIGVPELLLILIFPLILFFVLRQLMLWYWKINVLIENQQKQTFLLEQQIQLLADIKKQLGNPTKDSNQ
jgi:hypothetical protein